MFCYNCGTQLPDEATFCSKCGKPQKQGVQAAELVQVRESWETCEIQIGEKNHVLNGAMYWFWAQAINSKAQQYSAGKTPELLVGSRYMSYPKSHDKKALTAHKALLDELLNEGWELAPERGTNWWSNRLRRREDRAVEKCEIDTQLVKLGLTSVEIKFAAVRKALAGSPAIAESPAFKTKMKITIGKQEKPKQDEPIPPEVTQAFNGVVEKLIQSGWEQLETSGQNWYNKRFQRRLN